MVLLSAQIASVISLGLEAKETQHFKKNDNRVRQALILNILPIFPLNG